MPDRGDVVFLYDGTPEGLLTAVYEAWYHSARPDRIEEEYALQQQLGDHYFYIATDTIKSDRVADAISQKLGNESFEMVYHTALSDDLSRGTLILGYLRMAFKAGARINRRLTDPIVHEVDRISRYVAHEAHLWTGFARFSELDGGIYYAPIEPKSNVLPLIMPHFTDRFGDMPFILHDTTRAAAGISDTSGWIIVPTDEMRLPRESSSEGAYRQMWRRFYETIAVEGRINPRLRRQMMPQRYWRNMTEVGAFRRRGVFLGSAPEPGLPPRQNLPLQIPPQTEDHSQ